MTRSFLATAALVAGFLALQAQWQPADAKRGYGGWGGGHGHGFAMRSHSGPRFYGSFGHRPLKGYGSFGHYKFPRYAESYRFRRHYKFRRPFVVVRGYGYGYGYGDDYGCQWLRWRAIQTGSRYWWDRYYDCIGDYY